MESTRLSTCFLVLPPCLRVRLRIAWLLCCHLTCLECRRPWSGKTHTSSRSGSCCLPGVQKALAWHIYFLSRIGSSLYLPGEQKALERHINYCHVDLGQLVAPDRQRDSSQANSDRDVAKKDSVTA